MAQTPRERNWKLWLVGGAVLLVLLLVGWFVGVAVVPRWWAHFVGNRVDGHLTRGLFYGLLFGFVFTLLPLVIARQALRRAMSWAGRAAILLLAALAAVPNLMTAGIVFGSGNAAHAGERTLDVEAPWFRGGTGIAFWVAVLVFVAGIVFRVWLRFDGRESCELRAARESSGE